jgi:hypothetical protein
MRATSSASDSTGFLLVRSNPSFDIAVSAFRETAVQKWAFGPRRNDRAVSPEHYCLGSGKSLTCLLNRSLDPALAEITRPNAHGATLA